MADITYLDASSGTKLPKLFSRREIVRRRRMGVAIGERAPFASDLRSPLAALGIGSANPVVADDRPLISLSDRIKHWMATHMTYGGAGITTNRLNGGGTAPLNGAWGLNPGALTTAITDTALFDPAPEARVAGTYSQQTTAVNIPNDTAQVTATITASGTRAITEFGLFDTATAAPQTTTTHTVLSTDGTITLSSGTGFANAGFFQIDSEVCSITSGGGTTSLVVGRGARGSTVAVHASGANVVGGEGLAGGNMFMKGDFAVINLNNGDSIQFTAKMQYQPQ